MGYRVFRSAQWLSRLPSHRIHSCCNGWLTMVISIAFRKDPRHKLKGILWPSWSPRQPVTYINRSLMSGWSAYRYQIATKLYNLEWWLLLTPNKGEGGDLPNQALFLLVSHYHGLKSPEVWSSPASRRQHRHHQILDTVSEKGEAYWYQVLGDIIMAIEHYIELYISLL